MCSSFRPLTESGTTCPAKHTTAQRTHYATKRSLLEAVGGHRVITGCDLLNRVLRQFFRTLDCRALRCTLCHRSSQGVSRELLGKSVAALLRHRLHGPFLRAKAGFNRADSTGTDSGFQLVGGGVRRVRVFLNLLLADAAKRRQRGNGSRAGPRNRLTKTRHQRRSRAGKGRNGGDTLTKSAGTQHGTH